MDVLISQSYTVSSMFCVTILLLPIIPIHTRLLFTLIVIDFLFIFLALMAEISCIRLYLNQVSLVVRYLKMISYTESV